MSRLKPAIPLHEFEGIGAREDREARRAERRQRRRERKRDRRERKAERKDSRKERKAERRIDRVQRKKEKVREKLASAAPAAVPAEPTLMPAPMAPGEPPKPKKKLIEHVTDLVDEFLEEDVDPEAELEEEEPPEEEREATEGIGAWQLPFRAAPQPEVWGPAVRMGNRLKIQAAQGFRAAVIELKPGLFLVAEMPEAVARSEFGLAPILAPLMTTAARRSLDEPPQRRGLFRNLFHRRDEPIRYVTVQPPQLPAPVTPLALPGPVAPEPAVVPAPNVGWADDATVAAAYGCETCEKERR